MKNKSVLMDFLILISVTAIIFILFFEGKQIAGMYLFPLIKYFDRILRSAMIDLRSNITIQKLFLFSVISFVYGIVHAAGPGHGKALFSAYFINRKGNISNVLTAAIALVITHTIVSVFVSVLFIYFIKGTDAFLKIRMQGFLMGANGLLIFAVGMLLLFKKIIYLKNKDKTKQVPSETTYGPLGLGVLAGCVPCPVTIFVTSFSLTYGIPEAGIASVLGLSAGMFVLTSALGIMVVKGRENVLQRSGSVIITEKLSEMLEFASLFFIILIGAGMMTVLL